MIDIDFIKEELMAGERLSPAQAMELVNKLIEIMEWSRKIVSFEDLPSSFGGGYDCAQFDVSVMLGDEGNF